VNKKCAGCGRFVDLRDPATYHVFEPDSHFGPEVSEFFCGGPKCRKHDRKAT